MMTMMIQATKMKEATHDEAMSGCELVLMTMIVLLMRMRRRRKEKLEKENLQNKTDSSHIVG